MGMLDKLATRSSVYSIERIHSNKVPMCSRCALIQNVACNAAGDWSFAAHSG